MNLVTDPSPLSFDAIREYAEKVGRRHDIYDQNGHADIDLLVEKLGGSVDIRDESESMFVKGKGDFRIHIPSFTSARRDRFTKAHELGHYFLHYRLPGLEESATFARGGSNLQETQANIFAASLLMPEIEFKNAFAKCSGDAWCVARVFDVSPDAARVRASVLGLS